MFAIWAILIFVFKCCGTKRVGFLSGRVQELAVPPSDCACEAVRVFEQELHLEEEIPPLDLIIPNSCICDAPTDTDVSMQPTMDSPPLLANTQVHGSCETTRVEDAENGRMRHVEFPPLNAEKRKENGIRILFWTRIIAIVSGIGVILSTSVFINEGIVKLAATLDTGIVGMKQTKEIIEGGIDIILSFQEIRNNASGVLDALHSTVANASWCPLKREDLIESCSALLDRNDTALDAIFATNGTLQDAINGTGCEVLGYPMQEVLIKLFVIYQSISLSFAAMDVLLSDLIEIVNLIDWIIPQARSFYWAFYVSAGFAVTVDVIILVLLFGVYLAWRKRHNKPFSCARSYFVIPLLVICVFLMWLFAIVFCFTAILTADFCYDGPDTRLLKTLIAFQDRFSQHTFELIEYYLTGCPSPGFSIMGPETKAAIVQGVTLVHDIVYDLSQLDTSKFFEVCGVDITPLPLLMTSVHASIHVVADTLGDVHQLFLCSNIFPILQTIMYDAVCDLGVGAFRNIFVALVLTLAFCLVFITVRVAWQEEVDQRDAERRKRACPSFFDFSGARVRSEVVDDMEDSVLENDAGKTNTEAVVIAHHETSNTLGEAQPCDGRSTC